MDVHVISAETVRDALRCVHYGKSLANSPLLGLDALTVRLRTDGAVDSPQAREWVLGAFLESVCRERLTEARRQAGVEPAAPAAAGSGLRQLKADVLQGVPDLEAWSVLYFRYFAAVRVQLEDAADELGIVYRTLARRLNRGHDLLTGALRTAEAGAAAAVAATQASAPSAAPQPLDRAERMRLPTNLPAPLTGFVGRGTDVQALHGLVERHRLVTLIGPGGIGKTRLAIEVARGMIASFVDGAWWVELERLDDPAMVVPALAAALGVREAAHRPLADAVLDELRTRHALVVLDNCEHLVEACARLASNVLHTCPRVTILATSREALRVVGEKLWPVQPLVGPPENVTTTDAALDTDAVRLFLDRIRDVRPGFEVTVATVPVIASICRQLDGLPLAIELAAAGALAIPLDEVERRLGDRLRFLRRGDRTAAPRHQTIRAAVDWSWERLEPRERRVFNRLAVFAGGFTLDAAAAVCADSGHIDARSTTGSAMSAGTTPAAPSTDDDAIDVYDMLDLLSSLTEKSLIALGSAPDRPARYRMLETLRAYGRERLIADGGVDALARRHAVHFTDWAEAAVGDPRRLGARAPATHLDEERDNLLAALAWARLSDGDLALRLAGALGEYWLARGQLSTGRTQLESVLALDTGTGSPARLQALSCAGRLARLQCDYAAAQVHLEAALTGLRLADDGRGMASMLRELGSLAEEQGAANAARAHYAASLDLYRMLNDRWGMSAVLNNIGITALHEGDFASAHDALTESLAGFVALGDPLRAEIVQANLAGVMGDMGHLAEAEQLYEACLVTARDLDDRVGIAAILTSLGYVRTRLGGLARARGTLIEALEVLEPIGDLQKIAEWLGFAGYLARAEQRFESAVRLLAASDRLHATIGAPVLPKDREEREEHLAALRAVLGDAGFEAAWRAGVAEGWKAAAAAANEQRAG